MKTFAALLLLLSGLNSAATVHKIRVSNFQFSPRRVNAVVGDTILWVYKSGFHTTTSTTIPAGAAPWDSPMDANTRYFPYVVAIPGVYNYFCLPHAAQMQGRINVFPAGVTAYASNFLVQPDDNGNARLSWEAAIQPGKQKISLLKSADDEHYKTIISYKSAKDLVKSFFSYIDKDTSSNYRYYMLQIEENGHTIFQTPVAAFEPKHTGKFITSISPNPLTTAHLMLVFNASAEGELTLRLSNSQGVLIKEVMMTAEPGINHGHMHLGDVLMKPGLYYLSCTMGAIIEKYTLVKP